MLFDIADVDTTEDNHIIADQYTLEQQRADVMKHITSLSMDPKDWDGGQRYVHVCEVLKSVAERCKDGSFKWAVLALPEVPTINEIRQCFSNCSVKKFKKCVADNNLWGVIAWYHFVSFGNMSHELIVAASDFFLNSDVVAHGCVNHDDILMSALAYRLCGNKFTFPQDGYDIHEDYAHIMNILSSHIRFRFIYYALKDMESGLENKYTFPRFVIF